VVFPTNRIIAYCGDIVKHFRKQISRKKKNPLTFPLSIRHALSVLSGKRCCIDSVPIAIQVISGVLQYA
jgi:hypothetical protein